uniref:LRRCT domain-containing protein n=1 Tax=Meloidogyne incognita TaxID=6306 RepID=A0A914M495_MELIC
MPDFSKFLALRSLELCGNKLTEVPGYLLPINRFLEYDFRNNSLNKLGWDWSKTQIERISELKVDGNPLDCACPMPERLIKIVGELEKPKGYICVPKLNSSTNFHWQHPLEALDFIQTTSNNFHQNCPSKFSSKIKTETNNSINFSLFLLPILLITVPLIIGILMLLNISNWNDLHWVKTTTKSSMFAYEPLQIKNGNEENNVDNV